MATIEERLKDAPPRLVYLVACGFARTVEHLLTDNRMIGALDVAERFVDGLAPLEEINALAEETLEATDDAWSLELGEIGSPEHDKVQRVAQAVSATHYAVRRGVVVGKAGKSYGIADYAAWALVANGSTPEIPLFHSILDCILPPRIQAFFPAHVKGLATTIYERRDWSLMPILADAVAEMGLEDLAQHCRQPIHAKGCHVLDSIMDVRQTENPVRTSSC